MSDNLGRDDANHAAQTNSDTSNNFLVVGIGASAGGIKALKEFFTHVQATSGMAYVVILHLSPEHESLLAEVLQQTALIPVTQVNGRVHIEPNHVYVIPPNQSLSMNDGHLVLSAIKRVEERRAPVDIFFRTLAESRGEHAVCVILSGTGPNGSMGLKRVKEKGGVCIVQEPTEAEYSDMPRNSIATGLVDYVLPVAKIPAKINGYKEGLGTVQLPVDPQARVETDEQALRDIFTQLRVRTGHDFSNYKRATVMRRIERRINLHELPDLLTYARFFREQPEEARALLKDLLISVTNFFRDHEAFAALERTVVPALFAGRSSENAVRVWVAGCATGEEAYSVAMLLAEQTADLLNAPQIQVFATDIDEWAIAKARDGLYTGADIADISPERLRRFFIKEDDGYRVRRELRELVLFAVHNLIKDPPFSHLDLVSCRNLLIYLNRTAHQRVMEILHFALNPGSYLFLGTAESPDGTSELFLTLDKEAHIYQSRAIAPHLNFSAPDLLALPQIRQQAREGRMQETGIAERPSYAALHQRLLEQYAPPSVIINEEYEILHLSERAGHYLQMAGGEPSHNVLKLVRPELRLELRTALYQAVQNRTNVEARGLRLRVEDRTQTINLLVKPVLRDGDLARGFILVVFEEALDATTRLPGPEEAVSPVESAALHLEEELLRAKSQLRVTVEQYETQTEELKASNEELQAMNEELRTTAEELETSKEELQSVNEELATVNQELKIKIEELSQANNDFRNLMASTEIGTVFLDRLLHVKLFTPRACDIFNLIPADLGRPLSDITSKLKDSNLLADIELAFGRLQPIEREVETSNGRVYLRQSLPYRTADDHINGVVLTFVDITERKRAEEDLRGAHEELEQHVQERTQELADTNEALRIEADERQGAEAVRLKLLRQIVASQEDERRRIAREIHDLLGQHLIALQLKLVTLKAHGSNDAELREQIEQMEVIAKRLDEETEFLAWELRPSVLDDFGLVAGLATYVHEWAAHFEIPADYHASGLDDVRLLPEIETNLYRIAQEALNNVAKHAKASHVDVIVECRGHEVVLIIEDNGDGFDPESVDRMSRGLGLIGMRERAALFGGTLEIESAPTKGATIFACIPALFTNSEEP
jgi:two-component system CheB/CheR fusion protein